MRRFDQIILEGCGICENYYLISLLVKKWYTDHLGQSIQEWTK